MINTAGPIEIVVTPEELPLLQERMSRAVGSALHRARQRLETELLQVVPFRTGELFESMKIWVSGTEGLKISFEAPYARIVEMGAPPHTIQAGSPEHPLTFWWAKGPNGPGLYHYQSVEHPGYSGRGFVNRVKQMILDIVREELQIAILALEMKGGGPIL
jgi:hypothetical protein